LCLVAAKVLYFGVGGGVEGFVRAVEAEGGVVRTVWEHREGVGRRIMRIEW
jgi:protein-histidine N-methyltransferase